MSDFAQENEQLKNQIKNLNANITALNQSYSESLQGSVTLRTNNILFQTMIQEAHQKLAEKDVEIKKLKDDMEALLAPAPIPATQPEGESKTAAA